jgi:hypothetical protein
MGDIAVEVENLRADVDALHSRMIVERELADYWFERCLIAEAKYDEVINQRKS